MIYPRDFSDAFRQLAADLPERYFSLKVEATHLHAGRWETEWLLYIDGAGYVVLDAPSLQSCWSQWLAIRINHVQFADDVGSPDELATEAAGETITETTTAEATP